MRFGISDRVGPEDGWTDSFSAQLSFCKSDVERRLILGISEKYTQDERDALIVR